MENKNDWQALESRLKKFYVWTVSSLLSFTFLSIWLSLQWGVNLLILQYKTSGLSYWIFVSFQILFAISTLTPILIYICREIMEMLVSIKKSTAIKEKSIKDKEDKIAQYILNGLSKDMRWAVALDKVNLLPFAKTLFGERLGHFHEEKEFIADKFVPLLLNRCKSLIESNITVYLLIDSGTTLYPICKKLGQETVECFAKNEKWINKLIIVTNNLPGVEAFMQFGRTNSESRYSKLAIECKLLPGVPLPIYSAVTGVETNKAVEYLRREAKKNEEFMFISLVTGNWIQLPKKKTNHPMPLARGTGHCEFKETLINNSDEVYVVSPLGKIFFRHPLDEINKALGFTEDDEDLAKRKYHNVKINDDIVSSIKLVTTSRTDGRVLSKHSTKVQAVFGIDGETKTDDLKIFQNSKSMERIPHLFFLFDDLPENLNLQKEIEFPHSHTRRDDFMKLFDVDYRN